MSSVASTLGMRLGYTIAPYNATNPVVPTDKEFIEIPQVTDMPALSATRDTIETTPYSAEKQKEYIFGLSDSGGALEFTVNGTKEIFSMWNDDIPLSWVKKNYSKATKEDSVMYRYKHKEESEALWLVVIIRDLDLAWYQPVTPDNIGFPDTDVNAAFQPTLPVTPAGQGSYNEKPETLISYAEYLDEAHPSEP